MSRQTRGAQRAPWRPLSFSWQFRDGGNRRAYKAGTGKARGGPAAKAVPHSWQQRGAVEEACDGSSPAAPIDWQRRGATAT
eukprot:627715-Pyramimonas_sp.AAC.1